jgi:hypothetical protein
VYDNRQFCFYLQNRLIQTSQTGGQWYNDTSPFCIALIRFTKDVLDKILCLILSLI